MLTDESAVSFFGRIAVRKDEGKRRRILDAALKVFARDGYYNAKVSEIAKLAGVAHGTIYLYFKNKEDLLISIFKELMGDLLEHVKAEVEKIDSPKEKLRKLIELQMELAQEYRELSELMLIELRQSSKLLKSDAIDMIEEYIRFIEGILRHGMERGEFREDLDPTAVATIIYSSFEGMITRWLLEGDAFDLNRASKGVYSCLMEGIAAKRGG